MMGIILVIKGTVKGRSSVSLRGSIGFLQEICRLKKKLGPRMVSRTLRKPKIHRTNSCQGEGVVVVVVVEVEEKEKKETVIEHFTTNKI